MYQNKLWFSPKSYEVQVSSDTNADWLFDKLLAEAHEKRTMIITLSFAQSIDLSGVCCLY